MGVARGHLHTLVTEDGRNREGVHPELGHAGRGRVPEVVKAKIYNLGPLECRLPKLEFDLALDLFPDEEQPPRARQPMRREQPFAHERVDRPRFDVQQRGHLCGVEVTRRLGRSRGLSKR